MAVIRGGYLGCAQAPVRAGCLDDEWLSTGHPPHSGDPTVGDGGLRKRGRGMTKRAQMALLMAFERVI